MGLVLALVACGGGQRRAAAPDSDRDAQPQVATPTAAAAPTSTPTGDAPPAAAATLQFLGARASQIATGDLDGDGVTEIVFITEGGRGINRVAVDVGANEVSFMLEPWILEWGHRLVVADLDGDTHDDVVVVQNRGQPDAELVFLRSP